MKVGSSKNFLGLFFLVLLLWGCGEEVAGPEGENPEESPQDSFTAVIDGAAFAADSGGAKATATASIAGGMVFTATRNLNGVATTITINLQNIPGPGTYPLGVGSFMVGGTALLGEYNNNIMSGNNWKTPLNGVAGSLVIATLADGRTSGTFSFAVEPLIPSSGAGVRAITEGSFNIPITGTLVALQPNSGSRVRAQLNGQPYEAASATAELLDVLDAPGLHFQSSSTLNGLELNLSGVTGPGTFTFSNIAPRVYMLVGLENGTAENCCWGLLTLGDQLTVTVTAYSATRVTGTFEGVLQPQPGSPATQPLTITAGEFDIGL